LGPIRKDFGGWVAVCDQSAASGTGADHGHQDLYARFVPDQQLLFVAGLGRSGTTALMEVLVAHAEIALGVERFKRLYPRDEEPVTAELFEERRFFDFSDGLTNLTPDEAPEWAPHYDAMRAKWGRARYVGDKMVAIRLQHVWETLPEARFVCIVRDLEPVAASWEARARNPDDAGWSADQDATKAVAGWNRSLRRVRRAVRQHPDRAVVVEYDRFFGDERGRSLDRVLEWLGLDRSAEIDAAFAQVHATYVDKVAPKQRSLTPETLAFLQEHAERDVWDQVVGELAL
jgi:Sulfotransferase family